MNIEHQVNLAISPDSSWIEIDHASAAVDEDTVIGAGVLDFFDEVVDPTDNRNRWLVPKFGTLAASGEVEYEEELHAWRESRHYLLPDGRQAMLRYGDAVMFDETSRSGEFYKVDLLVSNQAALPGIR